MSTTDSIVSSRVKQSSRHRSDTTQTLGLFGTAISAEVLFFPTRAGLGGLIPILIMLVLAYPIAFYYHRVLARLCPSGSNPSGDTIETVEEHFDGMGGMIIAFLYFFVVCPLLWTHGVAITNAFTTFWENQLQMPVLNRGFVAPFLLLLMAFVIWFGKGLMVKAVSYLVWPFTANLVLIPLFPIPYWNFMAIDQVDLSNIALTDHDGILVTVWLGTSIVVFSFNFSPIVSSLMVPRREEYEKDFGRELTEQRCSKIISRASMLMVAMVMSFVFSCLLTLSPASMADAKAQNVPVLSYLANHFASLSDAKSTFATVLEHGASIIALVAVFKSFFGHYLDMSEGLNGLILKSGYKGDKAEVSIGKLNTINIIFIMDSTWVAAYANPNILDLIEVMGAPIIALLPCLLPMYVIRKAPSLTRYRDRLDNVFVIVIGLLTILNIIYKLL